MSISPGNLQNLSSDILEKSFDFYQRGGKLFVIQHAPEQDLIAQMVLSSLFTQILRRKKKVKLFLPDLDFFYYSESFSAEFLLVHNLPQFQEILGWLTQNNREQIIIATGAAAQWEQMSIDTPFYYYQSFPKSRADWRRFFENDVEIDLNTYKYLDATEKMIFERVLALDALGISVPIDLLANSLNLQIKETIDRVTDIEEKGLLECIEDEKQADLLVCSNSTQIARRLVDIISLTNEMLESALAGVINSAESENKEERYTVLNLFQSALADSPDFAGKKILSRPKLRNLIELCAKKLGEIWFAGDEIEHLLWGKILEDLQRFVLSAQVFDEGLSRNRKNPYLRQAKARMVGRWALVEPLKLTLAKELFAGLTDETAENPYFLQARGVFEYAARKQPDVARKSFKSALNVAEGDAERAYILTAWANLEIEEANFETAEEKLNQIRSAEATPYVIHIWAKLYYYRGDYGEALDKLIELFIIRPTSIEGWNLLGEMARRRAHWKKAKTALETALTVNSENAPTLRALGDSATDLGRLEIERGDLAKAQTHFEMAKIYFAESLEAEPDNFYARVSNSVLLRCEGELLKLKDETERAGQVFENALQDMSGLYKKHPLNELVTHNLGEIYLASGDYQKAKIYFEKTGSLAGFLGLAKAESALGNADKASEYLETAEKILMESTKKHSERIRVINSIAAVWINLAHTEKAENLIQTSFGLDGENGFTLRLLAEVRRLSGRKAEAESFEEKARDLANQELEEFLTEKI